jgi:hypothetical protein
VETVTGASDGGRLGSPGAEAAWNPVVRVGRVQKPALPDQPRRADLQVRAAPAGQCDFGERAAAVVPQAHRQDHGDLRPLKEYANWHSEHSRLDAGEITSTTPDDELARWVDREETSAARQGWRLLGALEAASTHREQLREREWDRLAVLGADIAWMENSADTADKELEPSRAERRQLVTAAIG